MNDIKVLVRNDNGVLYVIGATHQMEIHLVETDELEQVVNDDSKEAIVTMVQNTFIHPPEIVRGDFNKFIDDYINDEL